MGSGSGSGRRGPAPRRPVPVAHRGSHGAGAARWGGLVGPGDRPDLRAEDRRSPQAAATRPVAPDPRTRRRQECRYARVAELPMGPDVGIGLPRRPARRRPSLRHRGTSAPLRAVPPTGPSPHRSARRHEGSYDTSIPAAVSRDLSRIAGADERCPEPTSPKTSSPQPGKALGIAAAERGQWPCGSSVSSSGVPGSRCARWRVSTTFLSPYTFRPIDVAYASVRMRSDMAGWCSSKAGRSERMRGSSVKLCRGGGHEVAHSKELPYPHGSWTVTTSP